MEGTILQILQDSELDLAENFSSGLAESRIRQFLELLVKWNQKINLTAEQKPEEILKRHVFDSLQYTKAIRSHFRVMDIGSGAGFPGIPLKIIFPELKMVLVESQRKRCSFLETVVRELEMTGIEVINIRAEDISVTYAGQFDAVVFRAVSDTQGCLYLGKRYLTLGGRLVLKKPPEENPAAKDPGCGLGLKEEIKITNYSGLVSSLLVYENCFT